MSNLSKLLEKITKEGINATMLGDESSPCVVNRFVSTGCYVLDAIMGGGLPCGRIVEMYGDTSTGKSLVAAQACAAIQEEGGVAVYIDTETAVSLPIMQAVGVDVDSLIYTAPDTCEEVFKVMEAVINAKQPEEDMLIVWDSIAATSAESEMKGETGDVGYLTHARVISQGLRRLTRLVSKQQVACLFLNQAKQNIGVMWGDKVATFGGKSVGFHSSVRVMMKLKSRTKDTKKRTIGIQVTAKVTKNKIAPPFREAIFPIYFGHGIDEPEAALLYLRTAGLIKSSGSSNTVDCEESALDGVKFSRAKWDDLYYDDEAWLDLIDVAAGMGDLI